MTGSRGQWLIPAGCLAVLTAFLPLQAESKEKIPLLRQGVDNYKLGNYEKSIGNFQKVLQAVKIKKAVGKSHFYLALNFGVLGKLDKTRQHFLKALKADPTLILTAKKVRPQILSIFQKIRKSLIGTIEVAADRSGSKVFLNQKQVGKIPYQGKIAIGKHHLRVLSPDGKHHYVDANLIIGAKESRAVMAKLEAIKAKVWVKSKPSGATILVAGKKLGVTPMLIRLKPGKKKIVLKLNRHQIGERTVSLFPAGKLDVQISLKRIPGLWPGLPWKPPTLWKRKTTWSIISLGISVLMGTAAIVYGVNAKRASDAFLCGGVQTCWQGKGWSGPMTVDQANAYRDAASKFSRNANIFIGIAGAAAASSLILFLLRDKPPKRAKVSAFDLKPMLGNRTMGVVGELKF